MIKSISVFLLLNLVVMIGATPTPQVATSCSAAKTCATSAAAGMTTSGVGSGTSSKFSFGGMPMNKITKRAFAVRGGEVLEAATQEEMEAILIRANGALVVVDHWASWCGPCKMIAPLFEELSEKFENVIFVKVDVDENPDTAAKYSVSAMPTFVFVKNGEVVDRLMGANPTRLSELIEEHS